MPPDDEVLQGDPALTVDERTALLAPPSSTQHQGQTKPRSINGPALEAQSGDNGNPDESEDRPLPMLQILLLCFARAVEPIAFFSIFPFVNKMIWELGRKDGMSKGDVGFWSGLVESLFSLTQMVLMIPWGRAADSFGRKPTLVLALCGVSVGTAVFGLSRAIWQMVLFRCLAGMFSGTSITIRVMITEHSTQKTQARAFSYFAFAGNIGIFLGPLIGGILASPAEEYPSVFGGVWFFKEFPYALSTFATGAIGASAVVVCSLFVKETLANDENASDRQQPLSMLELITSPGVGIVLLIYSFNMLLAFAYTAILPLFYYYPPELGGCGLSPLEISTFMAVGGLSQSLWLLVAFPILQRKFGTVAILRACGVAWLPFLCLYPLANFILRMGWKTTFWIVSMPALVIGSGVSMGFTAIQLALNNAAPSSNTLGTLNAVALTLVCAIRSVAPALFTSIFAFGVNHRILGGHLVWLVLIALAFGFALSTSRLPPDAERKSGTRDEGASGRQEDEAGPESDGIAQRDM